MAIAAIVIPHFALRVALLEQPHLDGQPLILGPAPGERPVVQDATPEAHRERLEEQIETWGQVIADAGVERQ